MQVISLFLVSLEEGDKSCSIPLLEGFDFAGQGMLWFVGLDSTLLSKVPRWLVMMVALLQPLPTLLSFYLN